MSACAGIIEFNALAGDCFDPPTQCATLLLPEVNSPVEDCHKLSLFSPLFFTTVHLKTKHKMGRDNP